MNLLLLLDMATAAGGGVAVKAGAVELTAAELLAGAWSGAARFDGLDAVAYVGANHAAFPLALFAAAAAEVPFVPLNYRLPVDDIDLLLAPLGEVLIVAEGETVDALAARGRRVINLDEFVATALDGAAATAEPPPPVPVDGDGTALLLHTSGTTSAPKAAVLRHRHLTSYVIGAVEFGAAAPTDTALLSVPPYHIAGVANLLSNLYHGRRIVYVEGFSAGAWLDAVDAEAVTHAMVVPTMLARICEALGGPGHGRAGSLLALSYGGARAPATLVERAARLFPGVDLTNAYGLTETSSTIAVLGPDDHRAALDDGDPDARRRLGSAGRVLPGVEVEVRRDDGTAAGEGEPGEIWVRGEQVSGEYAGLGDLTDGDGWLPTRDRGWIDEGGYLFVDGRADDTIIRGGENISPAEIEDVILRHPDVVECAVVGLADDEWGQRIAAVVVARDGAAVDAEAMRDFARRALRSSRTPDVVAFVPSLPTTETGKLLRRVIRERLESANGD